MEIFCKWTAKGVLLKYKFLKGLIYKSTWETQIYVAELVFNWENVEVVNEDRRNLLAFDG